MDSSWDGSGFQAYDMCCVCKLSECRAHDEWSCQLADHCDDSEFNTIGCQDKP